MYALTAIMFCVGVPTKTVFFGPFFDPSLTGPPGAPHGPCVTQQEPLPPGRASRWSLFLCLLCHLGVWSPGQLTIVAIGIEVHRKKRLPKTA